jgi:hypothetical protein
MDKHKILTMEIPANLLIQRLSGLFEKAGEPNAGLIADLIVSNLTKTEVGIKHLVMGLWGITPKSDYRAGDTIKMNIKYLPKWRYNLPAMEKDSLIVDECVTAVIVEIDMYKKESLNISYAVYIDKQLTQSERDESWVNEAFASLEQPVIPRDLGKLL